MTEGRYTTAKRLVQLRQELSERQQRILGDVARIGLVSGQQLRQLHFSDDQASRRLARLDLAMMVGQRVLRTSRSSCRWPAQRLRRLLLLPRYCRSTPDRSRS